MYDTSEIRKGLKIELEGDVYVVVDFLHVKPGKGGAFIRSKLKSLSKGIIVDKTFRSGEKLIRANIQEKKMQFIYSSGENYCFMDMESYEQIFLNLDQLGSSRDFLKENTIINVIFHNKNPIAIELPTFVELKIIETEPGERGDTVSGGTKTAKLETGAVVQVPLFLSQGDIVKIDTRKGHYVERV